MQETLSIKVSSVEKDRLRKIAAERGVSVSALIKEALQAVTRGALGNPSPSCHDLVAPYFEQPGHLGASGKRDHSTNKRHLAGFGKSKHPAK